MNTAIEEAIKKFGSQRALSEVVGSHQTLISHYLTGKRCPSYKMAVKLQKAVGGKIPWYKFMEAEQGESERLDHERSSLSNKQAHHSSLTKAEQGKEAAQ